MHRFVDYCCITIKSFSKFWFEFSSQFKQILLLKVYSVKKRYVKISLLIENIEYICIIFFISNFWNFTLSVDQCKVIELKICIFQRQVWILKTSIYIKLGVSQSFRHTGGKMMGSFQNTIFFNCHISGPLGSIWTYDTIIPLRIRCSP